MRKKLAVLLLAGLVVSLAVGVAAARRTGLWTLRLEHKGLMSVLVDSSEGPVSYYYVSYKVTNTSGQELILRPYGKIVTETGQSLFSAPAPKAAYEICKRHNRAMLDMTEMAGETIPDGESRWGVIIFTGLDDKADHLDVLLYGFSNEYKYADEDNRTGFLRKVYQLKVERPGDADNRHLDKLNVVQEGWTWVAPDVNTEDN